MQTPMALRQGKRVLFVLARAGTRSGTARLSQRRTAAASTVSVSTALTSSLSEEPCAVATPRRITPVRLPLEAGTPPHQRLARRPYSGVGYAVARQACAGGGGDSGSAPPATDGGGGACTVVEDGTERFIVAARDLKAGDVVFGRTSGALSSEKSRHSVQVGEALHLTADNDLALTNHSCAPNCQLEVVEDSAGQDPYLRITVRAATIAKGDTLTIDYNAMELDMSHPFDCACEAAGCRGRIAGFSKLPRAVQDEYLSARVEGGALPPLTAVVRAWAKAHHIEGG